MSWSRKVLLGPRVGAKQGAQIVVPVLAPGERAGQRALERLLGVNRARVDGKAGALSREALGLAGEAELTAQEVHQVGRIRPVEHGEARVELHRPVVRPEQPVGDRGEGAGRRPLTMTVSAWSALRGGR
jgi:hypothetical protein